VQSILTGETVHLLDITAQSFDIYRVAFDKLAATIATALTVVVFFLSLRLKFSFNTAFITAIVYAFATSAWSLNSQGLRQHTISNLLVFSIVLCLFKANRSQGTRRCILLLTAGICCGLLPGVRLSSALYSIAAVVYAVFAYRKQAIFLLLGLPAALLSIAWNAYYFGNLTGGYSTLLARNAGDYVFSLDYFVRAFAGLLFSPSIGLLIFSPTALFTIPGAFLIWKQRSGHDEKLLLCLIFAAIGIFINYCFFRPWTGGSAPFGSRYMTDLLPAIGFSIAYFLADQIDRGFDNKLQTSTSLSPMLIVFLICAVLSASIQMIGVSSRTSWGTVPTPLVANINRVWHLRDSRIERHIRSMYADFSNPIPDKAAYVAGLSGVIEQVKYHTNEPLPNALVSAAQARKILRATVRNTGQSLWYGYETGMGKGEIKVRVRFFNANDKEIKTGDANLLHLSGTARPGESTEAIGRIFFPAKPGRYKMVFDLVAHRLGEFPGNLQSSAVELQTLIESRTQAPASQD
jgi:hypothetical protein